MAENLEILTGDCRDILPTLEAGSVQCCVTSPPYWGLRDYGTAQWEGGEAGCEHVQKVQPIVDGHFGDYISGETTRGSRKYNEISFREVCPKCGARRIDSQLGLEVTPEEYITNMVGVFREVKRVLKDDGTLWLNMGDAYAHNGACGGGSVFDNPTDGRKPEIIPGRATDRTAQIKTGGTCKSGLKPKDLCGIPWRLALALQADGWYLRSDIIWHKPNPMPESVTDRPTKAHEYIFLLTKAERYFYDAEAIREPVQENNTPIGKENAHGIASIRHAQRMNGDGSTNCGSREKGMGYSVAYCNPAGRNKRSVWTIATQPYAEAHFATFPEEIPKLCILAGSKPGDTVLDPFMGSGTTLKVALELGRKAIGIELNADYIGMAKQRCDVTPGLPLCLNSPFAYDNSDRDQLNSKESWLPLEFGNLGTV